MLRVITTFNDKLYRASARSMLQTVRLNVPEAAIVVYEELERESCTEESVKVDRLPEFIAVRDGFQNHISEDLGGTATHLSGWNRRWFGWFRKICAEYDALVRRPTDGLTLWFDTDIRITKTITEEFIRSQLNRPIGLFRGSRDNVEAGYIVFDESYPETRRFIERCMEVYTSGEFLQLEKWSDSDVLAYVMDENPEIIQDFAASREAISYQNSNGHETEGQIIPQSVWRDYVEHDKGLHWRTGVTALPFQVSAASTPRSKPGIWKQTRRKIRSWLGLGKKTKRRQNNDSPAVELSPTDPELVQLTLRRALPTQSASRPRVGFFVPKDNELHRDVLESFQSGVKEAGDQSFVSPLEEGWRDCDVAVTFGIYKAQWERGRQVGSLMKSIDQHSATHVVLERGFVRRNENFMVGVGGLNGRAEYFNRDVGSDRWSQLGVALKPWKTDGETIVVCGQVPWDSSVQHVSFASFIDGTIRQIREYTDRPVIFRPHPEHPQAIDVGALPCRVSANKSLHEDLDEAFAVVTFNSNAAVEAAIAGVPVFAFDEGSMAWPIANCDLRLINQPERPDREDWIQRLSYCQWNLEEMSRGLPWQHFRKHLVSSQQKVA